ncbi:Uncharacterized membrane protein YsdA, DUF1294 family [Shewanella morhuae]|uniref:DUF1294 domain-containing protein n=1 Tax=Shewanella morhuae TaxID=365591 RepID=UPI0009546846|nr:DUF1294 domain-containing protein [Shewanella morhuae]SIQ46592.1 Uncharacterized membrane protein YsdA, DUF1294 family [Shewanella morhuae]
MTNKKPTKTTSSKKATNNRSQKPKSTGSELSIMPLLLVVIFLAGLIGAAQQHMLPIGIVGMYLTLSLLSFIAYAIDKSAAKRGKWRTKESTLHLLALMGGWPGALFAQNVLRHKSVKASFRNVFWLTVIANLAVLAYGIQTGAVNMFI